MPYINNSAWVDSIAKALVEDRGELREAGIRGAFDRMGQSQAGVFRKPFTKANDTLIEVLRDSRNDFRNKWKSRLQLEMKEVLANKWDAAEKLLAVANSALTAGLGAIPAPGAGMIAQVAVKGGKMVASAALGLANEDIQGDIHARKVATADASLVKAGGAAQPTVFLNDNSAADIAKSSIQDYVNTCKTLATMKGTVQGFDEIAALPRQLWNIETNVSALNWKVVELQRYLDTMRSRLDEIHKLAIEANKQLLTSLTGPISAVLQKAYDDGNKLGKDDARAGKPRPTSPPELKLHATKTGGITVLAAHVAYQTALGYYEGVSPASSSPTLVSSSNPAVRPGIARPPVPGTLHGGKPLPLPPTPVRPGIPPRPVPPLPGRR